jgi:hypothetical protein
MLVRLFDCPVSTLVCGALLSCVVFLLLASLAANVLALTYDLYDVPWISGLIRMVNVNKEINVPTWFSSSLLTGAGVLALLTAALSAKRGVPWRFHWLNIGLMFLLLSLDEFASFHEMTAGWVRRILGVGGWLFYAWVVPGAAIVLLLSAIYLRFVLALPHGVRGWVVASAGIFLAGALGMEMIGGLLRERAGSEADLAFVLAFTVEEGLEMAGASLFIFSILRYVELTFPLRIMPSQTKPGPCVVVPPEKRTAGPGGRPVSPTVPPERQRQAGAGTGEGLV